MPSLEQNPYPIAFKIGNAAALGLGIAKSADRVDIRTRARSLRGMQKEAVVEYGPTGTVWRMACDEGAGLHGTDLAPFPLAFFNVGLLDSLAGEILVLAAERGATCNGLELTLINRYTREGSATQGTMTGKGLPAEFDVHLPPGGDESTWTEIVRHAVSASPADALMRAPLDNVFTIAKNGAPLRPRRVRPFDGPTISADDTSFDGARPSAQSTEDIIVKLQGPDAEVARQSAGSSMVENQRRELGVLGRLTFRTDGLRETKVRLAREGLSSTFRFLSDTSERFGGQGRAPDGLAYASAGIAFCFMTQVGRHAHTVKQKLSHYALAQDTSFSLPGASGGTRSEASAEPIRSHVHLQIDESDDEARTLVDMGEQSCFLHGATSGSFKTKVRILS